jgi:hypothetical protein
VTQVEARRAAGASDDFFVTFTDTEYNTFTNQFKLAASITNDDAVETSVTNFRAHVSGNDQLAPVPDVPANFIGALNGLTGSSDADSGVFPSPIAPDTSGSLSARTHIDFTDGALGGVQATFTISSQIPEPASVVLFGTMLLGTGLGLRRRFSKQA